MSQKETNKPVDFQWITLHYVFKDRTALLATCFMLVSCLAYSATLKMEVTCSSNMSVDFQHTGRYIPENKTLKYVAVFMEAYEREHITSKMMPCC
jgi:hypothetical protein